MTDGHADMTCSMEVFDPATNKFTNSTPYPGCAPKSQGKKVHPGLLFHSMVAARGLLVVIGVTHDASQPSVATFNTTTQAWTAWPLPTANASGTLRIGAAAAVLGGPGGESTVVAVGGSSGVAGKMLFYMRADQLDVRGGPGTRWAALPPMAAARAFPAAAAAGGKVYALGGLGPHAQWKLKSVEAFTPAPGGGAAGGGSWAPAPDLQVGREGAGAATIDGVLYAVGGIGGAPHIQPLASVEMLNTTELD